MLLYLYASQYTVILFQYFFCNSMSILNNLLRLQQAWSIFLNDAFVRTENSLDIQILYYITYTLHLLYDIFIVPGCRLFCGYVQVRRE